MGSCTRGLTCFFFFRNCQIVVTAAFSFALGVCLCFRKSCIFVIRNVYLQYYSINNKKQPCFKNDFAGKYYFCELQNGIVLFKTFIYSFLFKYLRESLQ